jgi:RNA polymerase sigma-70 factor (ECF subfamily)
VAAVLAGDRDAFRVLVERESGSVVRVCYRVLGDLHEAEDAAQEAFVIAFRSLASWRGDGPFGAWLARIALRIALRSAGRRRPVAWIDPTDPEGTAGRAARGGPAGGRLERSGPGAAITAASLAGVGTDDPAQLALRAERAAAVRQAVSRLEEPYREVVALRFFADLSLAEIAAESGRPLGTVKTHLHRGLLRLRRTFESDGAA